MVLSPFMVLSSFIYFYPPYFFCKVNANERNGKEILSFYLLRSMISIIFLPSSNHLPIIFISSFMPSLYLPSVLVRSRFYDFASIPIKSPQPPSPIFHISKMRQRAGYTPLVDSFIIYQIRDKNHPLYISPKDKNHPLYLHPKSKKSPSSHLLLRHKSFPSLVIIEDANLGNFPFRFVSYFDSCLRIIIWCTINTLSPLKQSAFILWGRRGT